MSFDFPCEMEYHAPCHISQWKYKTCAVHHIVVHHRFIMCEIKVANIIVLISSKKIMLLCRAFPQSLLNEQVNKNPKGSFDKDIKVLL